MKVLLAIFFPPGYFFAAGRPVAALFHLIWWGLSIVMLFAFGLGFFMYLLQVMLAMWDLRRQLQVEQATVIAQKMAEKLVAVERTLVPAPSFTPDRAGDPSVSR